MTVKEILSHLESVQNEKIRAHYIKTGAEPDKMYGVKLGDIRTIAKKLKANHELALKLWETKIVDAQMLAILLMKLKELGRNDLDKLVRSINFVRVSDWFNAYILKKHPDKDELREDWVEANNIWANRSGWSLTAEKVVRAADLLNLDQLLDRIEQDMPQEASEVQWTMNTTLVNIGIHHPKLRKRAIQIGNKLGFYKDYPVPKGCTTPFAPVWINEMVSRQKKK